MPRELAARIGGEEFALVLPEVAPPALEGAAERIRVLIGDTPIETSSGAIPITASVGGSCACDARLGMERELFDAADRALYTSKDGGRNRVTVVSID
jgi:diguanylate cyclase (GGDEF)-like protein